MSFSQSLTKSLAQVVEMLRTSVARLSLRSHLTAAASRAAVSIPKRTMASEASEASEAGVSSQHLRLLSNFCQR